MFNAVKADRFVAGPSDQLCLLFTMVGKTVTPAGVSRRTSPRNFEVRRRFLREHPGHVLDGWPLPAD